MAAITVQVDLMEEVRHLAEQRRISPEEIFDIALRRYLRDAQEHKIQKEAESFSRHAPGTGQAISGAGSGNPRRAGCGSRRRF